MRTAVGVLEVTSVEQVGVGDLRATTLAAPARRRSQRWWRRWRPRRPGLAGRPGDAGADPARSCAPPSPTGRVAAIVARLDRLDASSSYGAWTRETLDLIDRNPSGARPTWLRRGSRDRRLQEGRPQAEGAGLTESLAIGYRLSPRGEVVVDAGLAPAPAAAGEGTPLPRTIGAPATRALREAGLTSLERSPASPRPSWPHCTASAHRDRPAARGDGREGAGLRGRVTEPQTGGLPELSGRAGPRRERSSPPRSRSRARADAVGRAKRPRSSRAP